MEHHRDCPNCRCCSWSSSSAVTSPHMDTGGFILPGEEIIFIVYIIFLLCFVFQIIHVLVVHPCCFAFCPEYVSYVQSCRFCLYPVYVSAIRYMLCLLISLVQSSRFVYCCLSVSSSSVSSFHMLSHIYHCYEIYALSYCYVSYIRLLCF